MQRIVKEGHAIVAILKCAIGAGLFTLPYAFSCGGLYLSSILTLLIGLTCMWSFKLICKCQIRAQSFGGAFNRNRNDIIVAIDDNESSGRNTIIDNSDNRNIYNHNWLWLEGEERSVCEGVGGNSNRNSANSYSDVIINNNATNANNANNATNATNATNANNDNNSIVYFHSYAEIGRIAYPDVEFSFCRFRFNLVEVTVNVGIVLTSIGVSSAYLDFISENVPNIFHGFFPKSHVVVDSGIIPWVLLPILLLFCCQSSFKKLTAASIAGDLAVLTGLGLILIYGALYSFGSKTNGWSSSGGNGNVDVSDIDHFPAFSAGRDAIETHTLLYYFGSTSFLFAIHAVILPIIRDTLNDQNNDVFVISTLYAFITVINTIFGAMGYILFSVDGLTCPDAVFPQQQSSSPSSSSTSMLHPVNRGPCPSILSNIPHGTFFLSFTKLFICIDLLCTIPLVVGASRSILDATLTSYIDKVLHSYHTEVGVGVGLGVGSVGSRLGFDAAAYDPLAQAGSSHDGRSIDDFELTNSSSGSSSSSRQTATSSSSPLHSTAVEDSLTTSSSSSSSSLNPPPFSSYSTAKHHSPSSPLSPSSSSTYSLSSMSIIISRLLMLLLITILSQAMPHFGDVVSLVGGFVCALTGYILPPVLYLRMFPEECSWEGFPMKRLGLYLIIGFGLFSMSVSVYLAAI